MSDTSTCICYSHNYKCIFVFCFLFYTNFVMKLTFRLLQSESSFIIPPCPVIVGYPQWPTFISLIFSNWDWKLLLITSHLTPSYPSAQSPHDPSTGLQVLFLAQFPPHFCEQFSPYAPWKQTTTTKLLFIHEYNVTLEYNVIYTVY